MVGLAEQDPLAETLLTDYLVLIFIDSGLFDYSMSHVELVEHPIL
jgi:hypothetical protein